MKLIENNTLTPTGKILFWGLIGALLLLLLIAFFRARDFSPEARAEYWLESDIPCLTVKDESAPYSAHVQIAVYVNGKEELFPKGIGKLSTCTAQMHTDEDSVIHVAAQEEVSYTLEQFMNMIERSIDRPGMGLTATVNGEPKEDVATTVLTDGASINLSYTFNPNDPEMVPSEDQSEEVPFVPTTASSTATTN